MSPRFVFVGGGETTIAALVHLGLAGAAAAFAGAKRVVVVERGRTSLRTIVVAVGEIHALRRHVAAGNRKQIRSQIFAARASTRFTRRR